MLARSSKTQTPIHPDEKLTKTVGYQPGIVGYRRQMLRPVCCTTYSVPSFLHHSDDRCASSNAGSSQLQLSILIMMSRSSTSRSSHADSVAKKSTTSPLSLRLSRMFFQSSFSSSALLASRSQRS